MHLEKKRREKTRMKTQNPARLTLTFAHNAGFFPLSLNYLQFSIWNREFESLFQDNNADGTSRKGDEEEGTANVRKIPIGKRFFEFYDAPFTKFWFNTVSLHS